MKTKLLLVIIIAVIVFMTVSAQEPTGEIGEIISVSFPVQIVKSNYNSLYYIECLDDCARWYALEDISILYIGFARQCMAMNHWKLIMYRNYGDNYNPLPCP